MPQVIPSGLFIGADKAEIEALLAQLKAARLGMVYSGPMTGASINGQSVQFAGREMSLAEFADELAGPLNYFFPDKYDPPAGDRAAFSLNPATCAPRRFY